MGEITSAQIYERLRGYLVYLFLERTGLIPPFAVQTKPYNTSVHISLNVGKDSKVLLHPWFTL